MTTICTNAELLENQHLEVIFQNDNKYVLTVPKGYEDIWALYKKQEGTIWKREEVDIEGDITNWKALDEDKRGFIKMILAFFAAADGIVNENLSDNFSGEVQVSCIRAYYTAQAFVETVHCVTGDTRILTDNGNITIGDEYNTFHNVWNGCEFSYVQIKHTGKSPIQQVTLSNGMTLNCTPGHKWLIQGKSSRIETKNLKLGDTLEDFDYPFVQTGKDEFKNPYLHGYFCGHGDENTQYVHVPIKHETLLKYFNVALVSERPLGYKFSTYDLINKSKYSVPIEENVYNKLRWFEGVCDSELCVSLRAFSDISIIANTLFLCDIQLMLTTLGVISNVCDGMLLVSNYEMQKLVDLGFDPVMLEYNSVENPIQIRHPVYVTSIKHKSDLEDTFCFSEPKRHTGIFNGILTGQSETYSALIETYIEDESERDVYFRAVENFPCIKQKADWAQQWMNSEIPFAIRLIAFAVVEGVFFSGAFCSIFWLKDREIKLPGLFNSNSYIARDEGLHCQFATVLFKKLKYIPNEQIVHDLFKNAVNHEIEFITIALPVKMIGMNSDLMSDYIKFVADRLLLQLGYNRIYNVKNPFSFMDRIGMDNISNFHTSRVTEYARSEKIEKIKGVHDFDTEEDF